MKPDDQLTKDTPIAPADKFESPREESITKTDPHDVLEEDDDAFNEFTYPGETIDLSRAHAGDILPGRAGAFGEDSFEAIPWWAIAGALILIVWGGLYLGMYSGGFQGDVFNPQANYNAVAGPAVDPNSVEARKALGQKLFVVNCAQCHQASGLGQAGNFPPLVGSEWVVGDAPKRLTQILLHGIQGQIKVKGESYNNNMPAWNTLKDREIAAILTYIRTAWGNNASPISEQDMAAAREVSKGRSDPWSEKELLAIAAGPLPGEGGGNTPTAPGQNGPGAASDGNPPNLGAGATKPPAAPLGQGPAPQPAPTP